MRLEIGSRFGGFFNTNEDGGVVDDDDDDDDNDDYWYWLCKSDVGTSICEDGELAFEYFL